MLVPAREPPIELPARPRGPIECSIDDHVASLIPDCATIELGLGAVPDAVTRAPSAKRGLGVHSGAIGDGIGGLMQAGIVDNRHKEIDPCGAGGTMLLGMDRRSNCAGARPPSALAL